MATRALRRHLFHRRADPLAMLWDEWAAYLDKKGSRGSFFHLPFGPL